MFNAASTSPQSVIQQVQIALMQVRSAMETAERLYAWSSALALADLTTAPPNGPGMASADAQAVLSACADAYGLYQLYSAGTDSRNPSAGHVYGDSQKLVIAHRIVG